MPCRPILGRLLLLLSSLVLIKLIVARVAPRQIHWYNTLSSHLIVAWCWVVPRQNNCCIIRRRPSKDTHHPLSSRYPPSNQLMGKCWVVPLHILDYPLLLRYPSSLPIDWCILISRPRQLLRHPSSPIVNVELVPFLLHICIVRRILSGRGTITVSAAALHLRHPWQCWRNHYHPRRQHCSIIPLGWGLIKSSYHSEK